MNITRRALTKLISVSAVAKALGVPALLYSAGGAKAAEGRILEIALAGNALGIHIPAMAAITEILPSMPGYGMPKITRYEHAQTQVQTLIAGRSEFANPDPMTVIRADEAGADVKIIGNPAVGSSLVFVVNADLIKDFSDLAKPEIVVAVDAKGHATHAMLVGPLMKRGVDLNKVAVVEVGGSSARMNALLAKRAHAVPLHFDQAAAVVKQGNFKVLLEPAKEYRVWTHECWAAAGPWLAKPENRRAAVDLMKATIIAHRRATSDFAWYAERYRKYSTDPKAAAMTDEQIRPIWQELASGIKVWPASNSHSVDTYKELMPVFKAAGAVDGTMKIEQVVDTSFVEQALKELGS